MVRTRGVEVFWSPLDHSFLEAPHHCPSKEVIPVFSIFLTREDDSVLVTADWYCQYSLLRILHMTTQHSWLMFKVLKIATNWLVLCAMGFSVQSPNSPSTEWVWKVPWYRADGGKAPPVMFLPWMRAGGGAPDWAHHENEIRKTRAWAVLAQTLLLLSALFPDLSLANQRQYYLLQIHLYPLVVLPFLSLHAVLSNLGAAGEEHVQNRSHQWLIPKVVFGDHYSDELHR